MPGEFGAGALAGDCARFGSVSCANRSGDATPEIPIAAEKARRLSRFDGFFMLKTIFPMLYSRITFYRPEILCGRSMPYEQTDRKSW